MNGWGNQRILVIDDNPSIHDDFRRILSESECETHSLQEVEALLFGHEATRGRPIGFEVDSAMQGEEGLERIARAFAEGRPYAVAFVDVRMPPGWDGVETIERARLADPELQFVICSAYSDYSVQDIIHRLGVSDRLLLLKKPCDSAEILLMTTALCAKWNMAAMYRGERPLAVPTEHAG